MRDGDDDASPRLVSPVRAKVAARWLAYLHDGTKTIEGRLASHRLASAAAEQRVTFTAADGALVPCCMRIVAIRRYASFEAMLRAEGLSRVLPGVPDLPTAVAIYRAFYTEDEEREQGVVALVVTPAE